MSMVRMVEPLKSKMFNAQLVIFRVIVTVFTSICHYIYIFRQLSRRFLCVFMWNETVTAASYEFAKISLDISIFIFLIICQINKHTQHMYKWVWLLTEQKLSFWNYYDDDYAFVGMSMLDGFCVMCFHFGPEKR